MASRACGTRSPGRCPTTRGDLLTPRLKGTFAATFPSSRRMPGSHGHGCTNSPRGPGVRRDDGGLERDESGCAHPFPSGEGPGVGWNDRAQSNAFRLVGESPPQPLPFRGGAYRDGNLFLYDFRNPRPGKATVPPGSPAAAGTEASFEQETHVMTILRQFPRRQEGRDRHRIRPDRRPDRHRRHHGDDQPWSVDQHYSAKFGRCDDQEACRRQRSLNPRLRQRGRPERSGRPFLVRLSGSARS